MERHQAQLILDHLDIIQHFAKGGVLEFIGHDWTGKELKPDPVLKGVVINCLPNYRKVNRFIESPPRKYCSRWCPNKKNCSSCNLTKGTNMMRAEQALIKVIQIRESAEFKEKERVKVIINYISSHLDNAISKGDTYFDYKLEDRCMQGAVVKELYEFGYEVTVHIDDEEDDECPAILTISF